MIVPINVVRDDSPIPIARATVETISNIKSSCTLTMSSRSPTANANVIVETAAMLSPSVLSLPPFFISLNERIAVATDAMNNAVSMPA